MSQQDNRTTHARRHDDVTVRIFPQDAMCGVPGSLTDCAIVRCSVGPLSASLGVPVYDLTVKLDFATGEDIIPWSGFHFDEALPDGTSRPRTANADLTPAGQARRLAAINDLADARRQARMLPAEGIELTFTNIVSRPTDQRRARGERAPDGRRNHQKLPEDEDDAEQGREVNFKASARRTRIQARPRRTNDRFGRRPQPPA